MTSAGRSVASESTTVDSKESLRAGPLDFRKGLWAATLVALKAVSKVGCSAGQRGARAAKLVVSSVVSSAVEWAVLMVVRWVVP